MNRKQKTLFVITVGLLGILLLLLLSARFIVLTSYRAIEKASAKEHLQRVVNAIDNELDSMASSTGDYAAWDDTYRFMQDGNAEFIKSNLAEDSLAKLRVNLVAFVRPSGEIVFAKALDSGTAKAVPLPPGLGQHLTASSPLLQHRSTESTVKGVLVTHGTPILVVAKPILTNEGKGPIRGTLIMGRFIDAAETARLANITRLHLDISACDQATLNTAPFKGKKPLSLDKPFRVHRADEKTLNGFALIGDIYNRPALLAQITLVRQIYQQGVKTLRYFLFCCVLISLVSIIVCNWGLGKYFGSQREEETERLYAAALEHTAMGVAILEAASCRIVRANTGFSVQMGYPPGLIEGTLFREILADNPESFERCIETVFRDGKTNRAELHLTRNDRSLAVMEVHASGTMLDDQQYLCLVLHDITERKQSDPA